MQRQVHLERLSSDIGGVIGVLHVTLCLCIVFEMHSGVGQPHSFHADHRATKYPCEDGEKKYIIPTKSTFYKEDIVGDNFRRVR